MLKPKIHMNVMFKYKVDTVFGNLEPQGVLSPVWTTRNNAQRVMRKKAFLKKLQLSVDISRKFMV